jgi:hypothetical protein
VLFERHAAVVVNTQSQDLREKNGELTQLLALEQTGGRTEAPLSTPEKHRSGGKKFVRVFF